MMKVLIIGLGSIAKKHVKVLKQLYNDVEIYALRSSINADVEPGVNNIFDLQNGSKTIYDFAIISNPSNNHKTTILELLYLKIPLFIEKPIFDRLDADSVVNKIKESNIITYVACNLRFLGCISFVKKFVIDKRINEVNSYCGSYLPDWRPGIDFRQNYSANKEMGGGVHIDLIHEMDYIYWIFGAPKAIRSTKTNISSLKISAVDYANYLLMYSTYNVNIILNYYRREPKRTLEVVTNEGTILVNLLQNKVIYKDEVIFESSKSISDTYEDQLIFFVDQVVGRKEEFNTAAEAFEILKLCLTTD